MVNEKLMKTQALIKQYGQGIYAVDNIDLLNYSSKIQREQILRNDYYEQIVSNWLDRNGIVYEWQEQIPILGKGGKLQHVYIADFVIGNIVIEVDGSSHNNKKHKDTIRDSEMRKSGYSVIRMETDELTEWELWDKLGFLVEANRIEKELYNKYCHGPYAEHNFDRIKFVMNIYRKRVSDFDHVQESIQTFLSGWGIKLQSYQPIPIVSEGGKLEHLYLGYLTSDDYKIIIEIDPIDKKYSTKNRDKDIEKLGYRVIRIPEQKLSIEEVAESVAVVIYH